MNGVNFSRRNGDARIKRREEQKRPHRWEKNDSVTKFSIIYVHSEQQKLDGIKTMQNLLFDGFFMPDSLFWGVDLDFYPPPPPSR